MVIHKSAADPVAHPVASAVTRIVEATKNGSAGNGNWRLHHKWQHCKSKEACVIARNLAKAHKTKAARKNSWQGDGSSYFSLLMYDVDSVDSCALDGSVLLNAERSLPALCWLGSRIAG